MFAVLSSIFALARNGTAIAPDEITPEQYETQMAPYKLWWKRQEESFATQLQTTVRAPFGPNPQQYRINDMTILGKPAYQEAYQRNIGNYQPGVNGYLDWKMDPLFNSELNNYADFHMPEASMSTIQKSWQNLKKTRDDPNTFAAK